MVPGVVCEEVVACAEEARTEAWRVGGFVVTIVAFAFASCLLGSKEERLGFGCCLGAKLVGKGR